MKKFIFLLFLFIFISCTNDDNSARNVQQLRGDWFLTKVDCYCEFDPAIDLQQFTLSFEESRNVLHLDNPTEDYFYIAASGNYEYELEGSVIKIDGAAPFNYELKGSTLILTLLDDPAIADDELTLTYQRMAN